MPIDMGFPGMNFPGSGGSSTGSGYFEEDPYEQTENTPGYGGIVGSTPQMMDYQGALGGDISQAVINSWIDPQDQTFGNWDYFSNALGNVGFEQEDNYFGFTDLPQEQQGAGGGGYYSGGGGGGASAQEDIEWILGDYDVGGQGPDWWRPFTVKNEDHFSNPMVSSTLMMNALIGSGSLSEEDARSMAKQLYATWGGQTADNPWDLYSTKFGEREDMFGSPTMQGSFDPSISEQQVALGQTGPGVIDMEKFSRGRSDQALNALSMMREATVGGNVHEFGPGYQYLQEVAGTLGEAGNATTRAQREQVLGALDPMLAMSQGGELGGFSQMAQALASPFHTNLPPNVSRTQAGDYQFGRQNKNLFF